MPSESSDIRTISQLEAWLPKGQRYPAGLYLVATPIGNMADITLRALHVLNIADIILCEDTRTSRNLLSAYGIKAQLIACHDHNESALVETVTQAIHSGKRIALISDAGTPLISDPGYHLVKALSTAKLYVTSIPGASALTTALSLAALPTDRFLFAGFLPAKAQARNKAILELATIPSTLVLYEAPHRIVDTLTALAEVMGEREAALVRELTKLHEETRRDTLAALATHYQQEGAPKGEIVLVIAPPAPPEELNKETLDQLITIALKTETVKEAANRLAKETGIARKTIYERALQLKDSHG